MNKPPGDICTEICPRHDVKCKKKVFHNGKHWHPDHEW